MTDPVDTAPLLIDDEDESVVEPAAITAPLEALLLMATEPMPTAELAQAVRAPVALVERALAHLAEFYDETGRGFELRYVGGGWRYWTRAEHAELIGGWLIEGQHAKLSQAALETLAVVAYLQPISRSRVSAVRGVNVDGVLRTLVTRDLVHEVDRDPETGAMLFGTTGEFLERLGLPGLDDLPPIAPHLPDASELDAELRAPAEDPSVELVEAPVPSDDSVVIPADAGISRQANESGTTTLSSGGTVGDPGVRRDDEVRRHDGALVELVETPTSGEETAHE